MNRTALIRQRLAVLTACGALWAAACSGWSPTKPFEREAPPVKEAISALDAGEAGSATALLEAYLSTGKCSDGKIGAPDSIRKLSNGTFDLGLSLFRIGEAFGRRFGEEEIDAGTTAEMREKRMAQIDCALHVVEAIGNDESQPIDLRARAHYLEGNLHFLGGEYEQAVKAYDEALTLAPGMVDGGDEVGRDAAFNRAIALRRIEDKKDAGNDAGPPDAGNDASNDSGSDGGNDAGDGGDGGGNDAGDGSDGGGGGGNDGGNDAGPDGGDASTPPPSAPDASTPPPPSQTEDDRILDRYEAAPTFQQEWARQRAKMHPVRGMVDK